MGLGARSQNLREREYVLSPVSRNGENDRECAISVSKKCKRECVVSVNGNGESESAVSGSHNGKGMSAWETRVYIGNPCYVVGSKCAGQNQICGRSCEHYPCDFPGQ